MPPAASVVVIEASPSRVPALPSATPAAATPDPAAPSEVPAAPSPSAAPPDAAVPVDVRQPAAELLTQPGSIPPLDRLGPFESGRAADASSVDSSSLTAFVSSGGRLPVLMVTAKRERVIRQSLSSLLSCRGIASDDVIVVQDGAHGPTAQVVRDLGVRLHQKPPGRLRLDGASRIATHYGYALRFALETAAPTAPGVIVAEDDFVFSPDFYEYFHAVAPALEADPSLWLASAWNDNGNRHLLRDPAALRRTRYFPGLGWLLPRRVWERELAASWPTQHWDHWMRAPERHRGRDVLHPEVPRDYHIGVKGTFMDRGTHNHYFRFVGMQADAGFEWFGETGEAAVAASLNPGWGKALARTVAAATVLRSVDQISAFREGDGLVVHASSPAGDNHDFRQLAPYFGIWHEPVRAGWEGVHILRWRGTATLYLVHRDSKVLAQARGGQQVPAVRPSDFTGRERPADVGPPDGALGARTAAWRGGGGGEDPGVEAAKGGHIAKGRGASKRPLRVVSPLEDDEVANGLAVGTVDLVPVFGEEGSRGVVSRMLPWIEGGEAPRRARAGAYSAGRQTRTAAAKSTLVATAGAGPAPAMPAGAPATELPEGVVVVAASAAGRDCSQVCKREGGGRRCAGSLLPLISTCEWLTPFFGCSGPTGSRGSKCEQSMGSDQPALVVAAAPADKLPGSCLLNTDQSLFDCSGKWEFAKRLCPCV